MSPGPPQELLTRTCTRRDLLLLGRILQDLDTRTSQEPPARAFIPAPLRHGICKIFRQGPLWKDPTRISTRSSVKDLWRITEKMPAGFSQDLLIRTCARSCKDLFEDVSRILTRASHEEMCKIMQDARIYRQKCCAPESYPDLARAWAIDMHMDISHK